MARNLQALLPLVKEFGTNRIAFCTDDRDPEDIAENGHINGMVRQAVAAGVAPEDAVVCASPNPPPGPRGWPLGGQIRQRSGHAGAPRFCPHGIAR